jgi:hypothetical protein
MLLTPPAKRRRFTVFFLQPFRGRLCRGTPEPHPWPSGPARRPGLRSCWGRAGPAFSVGAPVAGRSRPGPGPGPDLPGPGPGVSGGSDGGPGWLRGVPTLGCWAPPAPFPPCWVAHCLRASLHCCRRRAARACLWTGGGRTGRRLIAVGRGSLGASWRCAALLRWGSGPLCPEQCASQDLVRAVGLIAGRSRKRD